MAWIESHQELARHPKTKRLARLLGCSVPAAIGHLHLLWWWATDYAPDGDLTSFSAEDVAEAVMWEGECESLVTALREARFLDGSRIHDWDTYAGRLLERRFENARRMRKVRAEEPPSIKDGAQHVQRTSRAREGLHTEHTGQTEQTGPTGHEGARRALAVPAQLAKFDAILRELPGYRPTAAFYEKTAARYASVDLDAEAIKLADWVVRKRTQCTTARVFNWLDNALAGPPSRKASARQPQNGHVSKAAEGRFSNGISFTGATP